MNKHTPPSWGQTNLLATRPREIKAVFHRLRELLDGLPSATVVVRGHRLTAVAGDRFALAEAGERWGRLDLWSSETVEHGAVRSFACVVPSGARPRYRYQLRLRSPTEIDEALSSVLAQAAAEATLR